MKSLFEVIRNWISFRLRSFLYRGTFTWQKFQAAVSCKLVSYIRVLTVSAFEWYRICLDFKSLKCFELKRMTYKLTIPRKWNGKSQNHIFQKLNEFGLSDKCPTKWYIFCWVHLFRSKMVGRDVRPAPPHSFILQNCVILFWYFRRLLSIVTCIHSRTEKSQSFLNSVILCWNSQAWRTVAHSCHSNNK